MPRCFPCGFSQAAHTESKFAMFYPAPWGLSENRVLSNLMFDRLTNVDQCWPAFSHILYIKIAVIIAVGVLQRQDESVDSGMAIWALRIRPDAQNAMALWISTATTTTSKVMGGALQIIQSSWMTMTWKLKHMAVCQNLVTLVNIKIAGKWMFIPLKMVLIGHPTIVMYL